MSELVGIHHVSLSVTNLDASAAWYGRVLGMVELFREEGEERTACVMRFPGGGYSVGLVQHGNRLPQRFDPALVGLDHLAFTVPSREDVELWAARLSTEGIDHSGVIDVPPGAILNFQDPDAVALAIFWDRPV